MALYSKEQLAVQASLTAEDLMIVKRRRREHNQLGFAYQISFVRLLNRFPTPNPFEVIEDLLVFAGVQLKIDPGQIAEYSSRRETVAEHQGLIRQHLKLKSFDREERQSLEWFLRQECFGLEQTVALRVQAQQFLKDHKILRPATSTLDRIIGEQRNASRNETYDRFDSLMSDTLKRR